MQGRGRLHSIPAQDSWQTPHEALCSLQLCRVFAIEAPGLVISQGKGILHGRGVGVGEDEPQTGSSSEAQAKVGD